MRVLRASLAAFLLVIGIVPAALAQGPLEITTPYPSVVADPGATASFQSTVVTDVSGRVDLAVTQQPDGWIVRLRGAGSTIAAVTTTANADATLISATFTAEVDVPSDAAAGAYKVVIEGRTVGGTTVQLPLDITVAGADSGSVALTTDFPSLRGPTSTNFRFNLILHNDTNQQITFGLESDSPAGWTVDVKPSGSDQATTAVVDAGTTEAVTATVKAPTDTPAGSYTVTVRAVGGPTPVSVDLSLDLTGTYSMSLSTVDGRLNARVTAGSASVLNIIVSNDGTTPLTNVSLTATPPRDWQVTFDPATIDQIPALQQVTVPVTITAADNALAGDYLLTINARATDSATSDSMELRTTVDTSPIGYLIGIAILIIVAVGLFFVFQRYGRR